MSAQFISKQPLQTAHVTDGNLKGRSLPAVPVLQPKAGTSGTFQFKLQPSVQPAPMFTSNMPVQFEETLEQKIIRILGKRKIYIDEKEAAEYASLLTSNPENTEVQIKGRHRALKLNRAGVISSIERRPPSDASNMRVSPFAGPMNEHESSMLTFGPRPLTGAIQSQDATITAASLADIPERPNLQTIMGGSAAKLSSIENSEWLHLVAHSLGGLDTPANLVAGPHSLNTAMIPFEKFVRGSARAGKIVDYRVTFFSDDFNGVSYVHHVEINISLPMSSSGTWTLEVNKDRTGEFINGQVLAEIADVVEKFGS